MKVNNPEKRLNKFWGKVDLKHIKLISEQLSGKNILDIGCGYGTTTNEITKAGFKCIGIDSDLQVIEKASKKFPFCTYIEANAEKLPFEDNFFDTIILRDSLHHLYQEADFSIISTELSRVSKPKSKLIFFDPNVNSIVKFMRKVAFHKDAECDYKTAIKIMKSLNYKVTHVSFNTIYSLPLSGGYVGINLVPDLKIIHKTLLNFETFIEKLINKIGFGPYLCWRYLIVGEKN